MDFRHLIVTCLFPKLRLPFDNQKVKENYAILFQKAREHEAMERAEEPIYSAMTSVYRS